jgi:hypothetical protein
VKLSDARDIGWRIDMDDVYKKQLEQFGIESTRIVHGDVEKHRREQMRQTMLSVVRAIMENTQGRQWMYSKLDMCGVFTAPIVAGDPYGTHVLAGIQAMGQNLLKDVMDAAPEQFYAMISEAAARKFPAEPNAQD